MRFAEFREDQGERYDHFVASQSAGSFLQCSSWAAWQQQWAGRASYRCGVVAQDGKVLLSVQLICHRLPAGQRYWYAPYGPVPSDGSVDLSRPLATLVAELKTRLSGSMFLRFEPRFWGFDWAAVGTKSVNTQPGSTLLIDLRKPEDSLLAEMHQKTRYNIRLAERRNVRVEQTFALSPGHGLYFEEALDLIVRTASRQRYLGYPKTYYRQLLDFFALHEPDRVRASVYKAIYGDELLASAVVVDFGGVRTYLFGGSSDQHRDVMAPYLLHWRAMQDAKVLGAHTYDFGGLETGAGFRAGFARFKLGFGGKTVEYPGAYDIVLKPLLYHPYRYLRSLHRFARRRS